MRHSLGFYHRVYYIAATESGSSAGSSARDTGSAGGSSAKGGTPKTIESASALSMVRTMGVVAALSGLLIVGTFQLTAERIRLNRVEQLKKAVLAVVPGAETMRVFEVEGRQLRPLDGVPSTPGRRVYAGYDGSGVFRGVAVPAAGMGFADIIRVLYGVDPKKGEVIGYQVLETKETPGLGDKIFKDADFLATFDGLDVRLDASGEALAHPLEIVKPGEGAQGWQIETITGATVSSSAVGRMMQESTARDMPLLARNLDALEGGAP